MLFLSSLQFLWNNFGQSVSRTAGEFLRKLLKEQSPVSTYPLCCLSSVSLHRKKILCLQSQRMCSVQYLCYSYKELLSIDVLGLPGLLRAWFWLG